MRGEGEANEGRDDLPTDEPMGRQSGSDVSRTWSCSDDRVWYGVGGQRTDGRTDVQTTPDLLVERDAIRDFP
jgi:hypothetical protein